QVTGFVPVQTPPWQVSVWVQALPSVQAAPSGFAGLEQRPVAGSQMRGAWRRAGAAQVAGVVPVQTTPWQVSVCVQALPSVQAAPSGFAGLEQRPVAGSQVPASWHWSVAAQVTGFVPVQTPPWPVSVCVQALPSVPAAASSFSVVESWPV